MNEKEYYTVPEVAEIIAPIAGLKDMQARNYLYSIISSNQIEFKEFSINPRSTKKRKLIHKDELEKLKKELKDR